MIALYSSLDKIAIPLYNRDKISGNAKEEKESKVTSLSDTFSEFFGPAKNDATGEAKCLYCETTSSAGGGEWTTDNTWVCDEHIEDDRRDRERLQAEADEHNTEVDEYIRWNEMQE